MASRQAQVTQADITRAIKAAQAAGLTVFEFFTTRQGVRVVTSSGLKAEATPPNPWDEVLRDGSSQ